mgnify:CR=1 FL=1
MKKRKLRLREPVKNFLGIASFYLIIFVGVIALNARMGYLNKKNKQKKADNEIRYQQTFNH